MNYERPYYEDINYHPLMFYVIFGAKEELEISRERHNLDEVPDGLNMNMLTREQHGEYMDNLIGGTLGKLLKEEQPELYERIQKENIWAIVNGEIKQDDNLKLDYKDIFFFTPALVLGGGEDIKYIKKGNGAVHHQCYYKLVNNIRIKFYKTTRIHYRNCKST